MNCSCTIHRAWYKHLINQVTTKSRRRFQNLNSFPKISIDIRNWLLEELGEIPILVTVEECLQPLGFPYVMRFSIGTRKN